VDDARTAAGVCAGCGGAGVSKDEPFEIDRSTEQSLYIKIDGEDWYLQNPMRNNYIFISDSPSVEKSKRIRFVKWEEILEQIV
jgi:hypothetical protein